MQGYTGSTIAKTYQRTQVAHANPVELIMMLYDGALSRIAEAGKRFQEQDLLYGGIAVSKAQAIVAELRKSLNVEEGGEIAANLERLYVYIHELLVKANLEYRTEPLDESACILNDLRSGWAEVARQVEEIPKNEVELQPSSANPVSIPTELPRLNVRV